MIEKLQPDHIVGLDGLPTTIMPDSAKLMGKINELCDIINTIQKEREAERFEIQEWIGILEAVRKSVNIHEKQIDELQMKLEPEKCETPVDPFAEQRKCICKLCWFWNDDKADKVIGILTGVFDEADRPFERNICQRLYKHCEPVKPDDDIIYKGV